MPRITHVISTTAGVGGAEVIMRSLLVEGAARGWEQSVLNPFARESDAAPVPLPESVGYEGFPCDRVAQLPATRAWLKRRLRQLQPDVTHVHLFHAAVMVASIRANGVRLLTHHHGDWLTRMGRGRVAIALDRWAGKRFDRVIAVSRAMQGFLVHRYRYDPRKVTVIMNGWEGAPPSEVGTGDRPTVLTVANLRPEKGHAPLVDAFAKVVAQVPNARLVLVGDGPLRAELQAQIEERNLSDHVDLVGWAADVWPYMRQAHVFALPSLHEASGIVVMEAMAAGLPVVAHDVGGVSELVEEGVTGHLVPVGDVERFSDAIVGLLRNDERRAQMGEVARVRAPMWTLDRTVASYFDLYAEVADAAPASERR